MAIQFVEGFDLYDATVNATSKGWSSNPSSYQTGRFGGQCFRFVSPSSAGGVNSQFVLPTSSSNIAFGFAYRNNDNLASNSNTFFRLQNNGTALLTMFVDNTARRTNISYAGGTLTSVATTDFGFNYYEVEAVIATGSGGSINLYKNGALIASVSGVNTGTGPANIIQIVAATGASNVFCTNDFDDMYVTTVATRVGEAKVETLRPASDTATVQWSTSSGSAHFSLVNETTSDGDTTYVLSNTPGNLDAYNMHALAETPSAIYAVQDVMIARKDDAGTRQVRTNLISGGTTVNDTTQNMSTSYQTFGTIHETDPNTSAAWTASGVNAAQLEIELVS